MTMNRILLVCIGNICRSPVAEALLKQQFPDKTVSSAGLAALVGHPADNTAQEIATQDGLDLSAHSARHNTQTMYNGADLLLFMERDHPRELDAPHPLASAKKPSLGQPTDGPAL